MKTINEISHRDAEHTKLKLIILGVIILVAVVVRVIYLFIISGYPNFKIFYPGLDAELYHLLAQRVAHGDLLLGPEVYYYSPFFAYLLGGLYALFGISAWVPRVFNVLLGSATIWFIYAYSRSFFESRKVGYIAAVLAALYGPFLVFDTGTLKSTSGLFFMAVSFYLLSRSIQNRKIWLWLLTGVFTGLALIDFGQMSFYAIAVCLWPAFADKRPQVEPVARVYQTGNSRKRQTVNAGKTYVTLYSFIKRKLLIPSLMIAGILLTIAPFTLRNYIVAGDPVLTACTSGVHLFIGNHKGAWGGYNLIKQIRPNPAGHYFDAAKLAEQATKKNNLKASEVSKFWKDQAVSYMKKNPSEFIALCFKRIFLSLHPYEIDNNENYQYLRQISSYLSSFLTFGILLPVGLTGLILGLPRFKRLFPLYLFFFCYLLSLSISIVTWRYRIPLTLVLFPFAGYAIIRIFEMIKGKRSLHGTISIIFCLGVFIVFLLNPIKPATVENGIKKAAGKMEVCKKEADLLNQLDNPANSVGEKVTIRLQMARLLVSQYDNEGAIRCLEEGLKQYPDNDSLKRNLVALKK
jgi:hypothetical protein